MNSGTRESMRAVPLTHATYSSTPTSMKSVTAIFDPNFVISVCVSVLPACVSTKKELRFAKYLFHVRAQGFLRCGLVTWRRW